MKNRISSYLILLTFLFLVVSGLFEPITNFFVWLVTLHSSPSEISGLSEIFVKVITFVVSYGFVGFIFKSLGWFNSKAMSLTYFIVSTLISFLLCYIVMIIEKYITIIAIILLVIFLIMLVSFIIFSIRRRESHEN